MDTRRILDHAPLPIARGYRRYLNAIEGREKHDAAYFLFEIYLKYVASIAIAHYLAGEARDHRVNAVLKGLARPSLGEWLRFLRECVRYLAELEAGDPAIEAVATLLGSRETRWPAAVELFNSLRSFRTESPSEKERVTLEELLGEVVSYRNRVLGHGANLDREHYERLVEPFAGAFVDVFDRSPFLTARRLVFFDSIQIRSGSRVECGVLEYMGDRPVRREQPLILEYGDRVPGEGELYLIGDEAGFVSLAPLLVAHREDVYVLNEARGTPEYLSYSTGERYRPTEFGEAQRALFTRLLGYEVDSSHVSQIGDELAARTEDPTAEGERRLGDYRVIREIGRGGMGAVFEAIQESLGRRVALKTLPGSFALDAKAVERFRREARATARIHHPSIVPVYEVGEAEGSHYYSMEYIDGASLDEVIAGGREAASRREKTDSSPSESSYVRRVVARAAELAEGLEQAHELGLVHRDIKPSNILVDRSGRWVLVDFGLVREEAGETLTRSGELVGTLGYMSPEQVSRQRADRRSDVYGLAVSLYEALTLQRPFSGESEHDLQRKILFEEPPRPRRWNPRLAGDLDNVLLHALEKDPERRYPSAAEFAADLRRFLGDEPVLARAPSFVRTVTRRIARRKAGFGLAAGLVVACLVAGYFIWKDAATREARKRLTEIEQLIDARDFSGALELVREVSSDLPDDPYLRDLRSRCAWTLVLETKPQDAEVSYRAYGDGTGEWRRLGSGPQEGIELPRGLFHFRFEKEGFGTVEHLVSERGADAGALPIKLHAEASVPDGMVFVPGDRAKVRLEQFRNVQEVRLPDFWIDRHEVTNAAFKSFVDGGGYSNQEWWVHDFVKDGRTLGWEEALREFVDSTGKPGPATWASGTYPPGEAEHPVAGTSWFEAAAYAASIGRELPTLYHWSHPAMRSAVTGPIARASNMDGTGPAAVGAYPGMSPFGSYDMAGNVREWCANVKTGTEERYTLGGAWGDPVYTFWRHDTRSPWDRRPDQGFRCVLYPDGSSPVPGKATGPLEPLIRDLASIEPLTDEVFVLCRDELYAHDREAHRKASSPVEDLSSENWRRQKISIPMSRADREDVLTLYLFLPVGRDPPYETVVYFPHAGALTRKDKSFDALEHADVNDFVLRDGRALLFPILSLTYGRRGPEGRDFWRKWMSQHARDLRTAVDYIQSREDLLPDAIAYLGVSMGAEYAAIMLALEDRFDCAILVAGGAGQYNYPSTVEPTSFAPRVKIPVLMQNGRYDAIFPLESQEVLFEQLGSGEGRKEYILYDAPHSLSSFRDEVARENRRWLDRWLVSEGSGDGAVETDGER